MGENLRRRLADLEQEASSLIAEIERNDAEARKLAGERRVLLDKLRSLRAEALEYKSRRDGLNDEVRNLKIILAELKREYAEKLDSLRKLRRGIKEHLRFKPAKSEEALAREINNLDWKIQTTPMPVIEEQKIIEQIKMLERQMEFYRKLGSMKDEIKEIEARLNEIKDKITFYRKMIAEKVSESKIFHEKMIKAFGEVNELKSKLNEVTNKYLEIRNEAAKLRLKRKDLLDQIHAIRNLIREEEERKRREVISTLKEKIKRETLEKIRRGEKVSFEEFRILVEEDEGKF
ncbi:MAG: hypothetical protein QW782_00215 [Candidatus Bathyarchaeia archaeon]